MIDKCGLNSGVAISATDEMPQELIDLDAKASNILDDTHPKYRFRLLLNFLDGSKFDDFFLCEADCVGKLLSGQREVCNKKQRSEEKEY